MINIEHKLDLELTNNTPYLTPYSHRVASGQGKVREKIIFQGQGKVREFCKKSGTNYGYGKVRKKSGNFVMNAHDTFFFITVLHLYVPYFSASYRPRWKNPCIFLYNMIFLPLKSFLGRKYVCWAQFIDLLSLGHDTGLSVAIWNQGSGALCPIFLGVHWRKLRVQNQWNLETIELKGNQPNAYRLNPHIYTCKHLDLNQLEKK